MRPDRRAAPAPLLGRLRSSINFSVGTASSARKLKEKPAVLRTRLSLTPEQEAETAKALEYGQSKIKISPPNVIVSKAAPEDIRKMEEAISATLSPAQRAEYESFRAEEKANALEAVANRELSHLQSMMNLSQEQKDQAFAVFSEIAERESALPALEPGGEREAKAIEEAVNARWTDRREALSAILTPEQMAVYISGGKPLQTRSRRLMADPDPHGGGAG